MTQSQDITSGGMLYAAYYTTSGSLGGITRACASVSEGDLLSLACPGDSKIKSVEAFYGTPEGSCSCPAEQKIDITTGNCPATPDFSKYSYGECTTASDDDTEDVKACFQGKMWSGGDCCAYDIDPVNHWPDFTDLAFVPTPGCNSASAQFIAQAACLGRQNCTIEVSANQTFHWEESARAPCGEGTLVNRECSVSLNSPSSNFTTCPEDPEELRFIARAVCASNSFAWSPGGPKQSRISWNKVCSYIDACCTFIIFAMVLWMADKEQAAVIEADMAFASADDFTLRIKHLPPPVKGQSPDLEKLKDAIRLHFDTLLTGLKPVIKERKCQVFDVNFGLNNQDTLRLMKKRGDMARILDLATEKLTMMQMFNTASEKKIKKQDETVRILKVKFIAMCERVKFRKRRLEAKTAFVTFDSEEAYERIRKCYMTSKFGWCGPPRKLYFQGNFWFKLEETMRPSDYIWENLSTPYPVRVIKFFISNLLALLLLVLGFAAIIQAKDQEMRAKLRVGDLSSCSAYEFMYSGSDPTIAEPWLWENRFITNETTTVVTRDEVRQNEFPDKYNITYPNTGLLGCYCKYVFDNYLDQVSDVEFENPETKEPEYWCADWESNYTSALAIAQLAVLSVIVVNILLKSFFRALVAFEGHETRTQEILSLALKLFFAMLVNTALLIVLISGNLNILFRGANNVATRALDALALFQGSISDFTPEWYLSVGCSITVLMFTQAFTLNSAPATAWVQVHLMRCLDRGCTFDMTRTRQKLQVQLETLYTGPVQKLEERYAALLVCYTVCTIYSGGMPILYFVGFLSFQIALLADKWAFVRLYQLPPKYGSALARACTDQLPLALLVRSILAIWAYTEPNLYPTKNVELDVVPGNVTQTDYGERYNGTRSSPYSNSFDFSGSDIYTPFDIFEELERALLHPNSLPHDVMILIWAVWFASTKILNLDDFVLWCRALFQSKDVDFAEAGTDMETQVEEDAKNKERWAKMGISEEEGRALMLANEGQESKPVEEDPEKDEKEKDGKEKEDGKEKADGEEEGDKADSEATEAVQEKAPKKGAFGGLFGGKKKNAKKDKKGDAENETEGGAPSGTIDDEDAAPAAAESEAKTEGPAKDAEGGSHGVKSVFVLDTTKEKMEGDVHVFEVSANDGLARQETLDDTEIALLEHSQKNQELSAEAQAEQDALRMGRNAKTLKKGGSEAPADLEEGKKGKNVRRRTMPNEEGSLSDAEYEEMKEFREKWLTVCEFVQQNRGRRLIEGNGDFLWSIPDDVMKGHVYARVLNRSVRTAFVQELEFRKRYPDTAKRLTRMIQGITTFDFYGNSDYAESFALSSKSIKAYMRGKIQVSGDDFELAHRGCFNWCKRNLLGMTDRLDVVFPEIRDDLNAVSERHVTAVGIDPTKVAGPRFVINLRVPPPPKNLFEGAPPNVITDMNHSKYDEWEENWQYLRLSIKNVFSYRVRLPKGLQAKKVPEVQLEVPAVLQTLSAWKTIDIAGVRQISDPRHVAEEHTKTAVADGFMLGTMAGVTDSSAAERVDHALTATEANLKTNRDMAVERIQRAWLGKAARLRVQRMKSWQSRCLIFLESIPMTCFGLALVAIDMTFTFALAEEMPLVTEVVAYFATFFFAFELGLRFGCYAYLSRGKGLDCADFDFFTKDWIRMIDLITVVLDVAATAILIAASQATDSNSFKFMKSSKGARVVRLAKLIKVVRVLRISKVVRLAEHEKLYILTGRENVGMQRYHIKAPKEVEIGNRLEVMLPHLGKLQIQWPSYAKEDQPVQFHFPTVCKHHFGQISPNCKLVQPSLDVTAESGGDTYSGAMGQYGWIQLWNANDDHGLVPPPKNRFAKKPRTKQVVTDARGKKHTITREETAEETCNRCYKNYYDDYSMHRVWYQVMAFAPKPVLKRWTDLSMFAHELDLYKDCVVMTLKPGESRGERIECIIGTSRGAMHGQEHMIHVPGVGDVLTTLLATNEVIVPGLQGHELKALGVLPWSSQAQTLKTLVPDVIGEVTFDFPAIMLPKATEIISMKFAKPTVEVGDDTVAAVELGSEKKKGKKEVSAGKYLERDTYTKSFQVMPKEFKAAMRVAKKKKKVLTRKEAQRHYNCCGCHKLTKEEKAEKKAHDKEDREALKAATKADTAKKGCCVLCSSLKGTVKAAAEKEGAPAGGVELAQTPSGPVDTSSDALDSSEGAPGQAVSLDEPEEAEALSPAAKEPSPGKESPPGKSGKVKTPPPKRSSNSQSSSRPRPSAKSSDEGDLNAEAPAAAAASETEAAAAATEGGAPAETLLDDSDDEDESGLSLDPVVMNKVAVVGGAPGEPEADASRDSIAGGGGQSVSRGSVGISATDAQLHEDAQDKAAAAVAASEESARVAARTRAATVAEAMAEADDNMDGVNQTELKEKAANFQRINLPRVGRFDVQWPEGVVEPYTVSFPAIKPAKILRDDVASLIEPPSDSAATSPLARRYQFGWVLVLMHEASPSGKSVYLRLPAYVSHKQRALGTLDPNDFASPYSNRLHGAAGVEDADAKAAAVRAAKAEARVAALEAELAQHRERANIDPTAAPGTGTNPGEEYKGMGSGI